VIWVTLTPVRAATLDSDGRPQFIHSGTYEELADAFGLSGVECITGGPNWLDSEHFDVIAKAPAGTSLRDVRLMLRALLANRFKLETREGAKVITVFALTVAKHGPNLKPAESGSRTSCGPGQSTKGQIHAECTNLTLTDLADYLPDLAPGYFDVPAVDSTGIKGAFDFKLDWVPRSSLSKANTLPEDSIPETSSGPSIFDALEKQFGLKVERRKQAMPVVVVVHC
jgi:uncharacterized protein (TIGR03435 family)